FVLTANNCRANRSMIAGIAALTTDCQRKQSHGAQVSSFRARTILSEMICLFSAELSDVVSRPLFFGLDLGLYGLYLLFCFGFERRREASDELLDSVLGNRCHHSLPGVQ